MAKGTQKMITAKSNIYFSIPFGKWRELMLFRQTQLAAQREENPNITLPFQAKVMQFSHGQTVMFSEEGEFTEEGVIISYPMKLFDEYAAQFFNAHNPIRGEIQSVASGDTLQGIPEDIKRSIVEKMESKSLNSPYIKTPFFEKVA